MTIIEILTPVLVGKSVCVYTYGNSTHSFTNLSSSYGDWSLIKSEVKEIVSISNAGEYEGDNLVLHFDDGSERYCGLETEFEFVIPKFFELGI